MARYSAEMKTSVIQKMMPPNNVSIAQIALDTGITRTTLYTWRKQARNQGVPVPGDGKNPDQWKPEDQLAVIIETAVLNETEMAEYCRKKGLFVEQIQQWKTDFINARSLHSERQSGTKKPRSVEHKKDQMKIKKHPPKNRQPSLHGL